MKPYVLYALAGILLAPIVTNADVGEPMPVTPSAKQVVVSVQPKVVKGPDAPTKYLPGKKILKEETVRVLHTQKVVQLPDEVVVRQKVEHYIAPVYIPCNQVVVCKQPVVVGPQPAPRVVMVRPVQPVRRFANMVLHGPVRQPMPMTRQTVYRGRPTGPTVNRSVVRAPQAQPVRCAPTKLVCAPKPRCP